VSNSIELTESQARWLGLPTRSPIDNEHVVWAPFDADALRKGRQMAFEFALVASILGDAEGQVA